MTTTTTHSPAATQRSDDTTDNGDAHSHATPATVGDRRPRAAETGDPLVLGLPLIALGAVALGLQLIGYVDASSVGSPLAILIAASGLGLLIATIWSTRLESTPVSSPWSSGRSLPTIVLGALAAFFLSYGALVLGLVHSWYGIQPADIAHSQALFQISWLVAFVILAVASVRLPAAFTVLFGAFSVVLILLLISTLNPSDAAGKIGGVVVLIIAAAAAYVFLAVASAASGGREYPIGAPLLK
ncbi:GPR1/FUN34/YaaH family transporter [Antrihabitans sp. YC2-6]|uniref:GPR1/FUN34/YaaH family transporter n=1 Tax=Antrihabitans sp. YC2-6 TaxID=2799498 RepID=UPI0018F35F73|nr:GPR1/FUN34/YaaH family transporter [Antrihabitans sp. YC2-6]MBJ8347170.1 hypothetical protein [Antrihabitans sp. YC2-6]